MDINTGKEIFSEVLQVEEKNRPWAREIIVIAFALAFSITTFFVFQSQKSEAVQEKLEAKAELKSLQLLYVAEGKECPKLIQDAVEKRDLYWGAKFDNLQADYIKKFNEDKTETLARFKYYEAKTAALKDKSEKLNKKVSL